MASDTSYFERDLAKPVNQLWLELVKKYNDVEVLPTSTNNDVSLGYQIYINKIAGLKALNLSVIDAYNYEYQIRLTLFDIIHKRFLGKTFHSKFFKADSKQQEVLFKLPVYFLSTIVDNNLFFVAEVVIKSSAKNPLPKDLQDEQIFSGGWGFERLFPTNQQIHDLSNRKTEKLKKMELIFGSPRSLFYLNEPLEVNTELKKTPGCCIFFSFHRHASLFAISHLMQENMIYSCDEKVVGLKNQAVQIKESLDFYLQPTLLPAVTGFIENIRITFTESIETFENDLCNILLNNQLNNEDIEINDRCQIQVTERRLEVGVHNGNCFIHNPQNVHLDSESSKSIVNRNRSFGKGRTKVIGNDLVFRSRLQFEELINDPKISIVFKLHYILSIPTTQKNALHGTNHQILQIMIGWSAWTPFNSKKEFQNPIIMKFYGGVSVNPSRQFFYKTRSYSRCEISSLSFDFFTESNQQRNFISSIPQVSSRIEPQIDKMQGNMYYVKSPDKKKQERHSEVVRESFQPIEHSSPLKIADLDRDSINSLPPSQPASFSRSIRPRACTSFLNQFKFPAIVDSNGNPAVLTDSNNAPNICKELNNPLQASEIIIEFQAYCYPAKNGKVISSYRTNKLFFTFQFYRFKPISTERTSICTTKFDAIQKINPRVLRKINSNKNDPPGIEIRYLFDPSLLPNGESKTFIEYLASESLHIDVWDGDSLMLIGSVCVPLNGLLRGGRSAVYVEQDVDVLCTEYSDASCISGSISNGAFQMIGVNTLYKGKLHLRLSNIGHCAQKKLSTTDTQRLRTSLVDASISGTSFKGGTIPVTSNQNKKIGSKVCVEKVTDVMKDSTKLLLNCSERVKERVEGDLKDSEIRRNSLKDSEIIGKNLKDSEIIGKNLKDLEIKENNLKDSEIIENNLVDSEIKENNLKDSEIKEQKLVDSEIKEQNLVDSEIKEQNLVDSKENPKWCCAKILLMLTRRLYSTFHKNSKVDAVQPEVCCKHDNCEEKLTSPNFVPCDCRSICIKNIDQVKKDEDLKVFQADLTPDLQQRPSSQKSDLKLTPTDVADDLVVDLNILEEPQLFKLHFDNFSNMTLVRNDFDDDCCSFDNKIPTTPCTEEHLRKVSRMKAVRDEEWCSDKESQRGRKKTPSGQRAILSNQERSLQIRDLLTVIDYRNDLRDEQISEMLLMSITTCHTIYPSFGEAQLIEFRLRNPFESDEKITVICNDPDLRVITDAREWRYFKALNKLSTPIEENMFTYDPITGQPQFQLHPREVVILPFRYQGFHLNNLISQQTCYNPTNATTLHTIQPLSETKCDKNIKVILRAVTDNRPISILDLLVRPQPHTVNYTFRFFHPEKTFLKKCLRLPPFPIQTGNERFHAVCSDPDVICHARAVCQDDPKEIYIKSPCGESPEVKCFFVTLFSDEFTSKPCQIWQFYVHSLEKVDVTCVLGQTSKLPLTIRGGACNRLLKCHSSHPCELKIEPDESFMLPANNLTQIDVSVRGRQVQASTTRYLYINIVDSEFHQLFKNWLVAVKIEEPVITKEFNLKLPRGGSDSCNKMISYTNPYECFKQFHLSTSRSDLLKFREDTLKLAGLQKTNIGLRFQTNFPALSKASVYVFINDEQGKNEESFLINVTYVC